MAALRGRFLAPTWPEGHISARRSTATPCPRPFSNGVFCEAAARVKIFWRCCELGQGLVDRAPSTRSILYPFPSARFLILLFALIKGNPRVAGARGEFEGAEAPSSPRLSTSAIGSAALIRSRVVHFAERGSCSGSAPPPHCEHGHATALAGTCAPRGCTRRRGSYSVPSRHIAYRMPASRPASATVAILRPRRSAIRSAHCRRCSVSEWRERRMHHAASTSSQRIRGLPALVTGPRCCRSPELCSPGTSPR